MSTRSCQWQKWRGSGAGEGKGSGVIGWVPEDAESEVEEVVGETAL